MFGQAGQRTVTMSSFLTRTLHLKTAEERKKALLTEDKDRYGHLPFYPWRMRLKTPVNTFLSWDSIQLTCTLDSALIIRHIERIEYAGVMIQHVWLGRDSSSSADWPLSLARFAELKGIPEGLAYWTVQRLSFGAAAEEVGLLSELHQKNTTLVPPKMAHWLHASSLSSSLCQLAALDTRMSSSVEEVPEPQVLCVSWLPSNPQDVCWQWLMVKDVKPWVSLPAQLMQAITFHPTYTVPAKKVKQVQVFLYKSSPVTDASVPAGCWRSFDPDSDKLELLGSTKAPFLMPTDAYIGLQSILAYGEGFIPWPPGVLVMTLGALRLNAISKCVDAHVFLCMKEDGWFVSP